MVAVRQPQVQSHGSKPRFGLIRLQEDVLIMSNKFRQGFVSHGCTEECNGFLICNTRGGVIA